MYKNIVKVLIDFIIAIFLLLILSPLLVIVTVLLAIANKGKPFFIQSRPGKNEKIFKIIKFKTMNDNKDSKGNLLSDEKRLTNLGKFMRKTSIDELLQIFNVLKGDMSFIGPRPLLIEYLDLYSFEQKKRHLIKPGITGWAQVNGRNAISWNEKFKLDVFYVQHISFLLDLKILFQTIKKVIMREGISSATSATKEYFKGNN
ncbi:MAG: sugar transferase [Polaribacter sp.]|jgi:lipopolysaccharide/colanic/teichoic acid biosynthesis glycosyltransferase|nr:sugar transferase [Polaribacter sp.]